MRFPMVARCVCAVAVVAAFGLRDRCAFAQSITEFTIPTAASFPEGIAAGPDGNVWFTESFGNKIGRISADGVIDEFPVPTPGAALYAITAGPDGNLWFTERLVRGQVGHGKIGRITPVGVVTEFPTPTPVSAPQWITAGPDGNLWFVDAVANNVGRVTTAGVITEFPIPTPESISNGIAAGPDGNLWFTEVWGNGENKIGRITPDGAITEFSVPTFNVQPLGITAGPDGNLWFTENVGGKIATITTDGVITELLSGLDHPWGITVGSDDNLWFVENGTNRVWRLTPGGVGTPYPIPTAFAQPRFITPGPDGALWFTEYKGNKIGRITTLPLPAPTVDGIAPSSGSSAGGTSISIAGSGFQPGATASIGAPVSGVFVSDTEITATAPFRVPGTLTDVVVTNPDASTGTLAHGWLADFLDVDGSDGFHDSVEKIFRKGITAGCGGGNYCRESPVSRAQMAVFLLKTEHGAGYAPPDCKGVFSDVACPGTFTNWIEQLASEGITGGCGDGSYCPDDPVTRQQMAVFLLKTEHGPSYSPPSCAGIFEDVGCPSPYADWIEQLYAEQATGGCSTSPSLYCPERPVTRGQMAVFLVKTFHLP